MIYYECYGHIYADFESAKNKMYNFLVYDCCAFIKEYKLYDYSYSSTINSLPIANTVLNLIKEDNYKEISKIIKGGSNPCLHAYLVIKRHTKKYTYKTDKLAKCLNDIKPLIKKEIFK